MRYFALATDYDGTLAYHGEVLEPTLNALIKLKNNGRKLIMVTGRELPELKTVFPHLDMFDKVVAENGALVYDPAKQTEKILVESPDMDFVNELVKRGVERVSVGKAIIATWRPWENIVLDTIRDFGLELQVIFNKDAVMILPSGMNKASGLKVALDELKLSFHNIAGIGDAENDHAFLSTCGFSVAVDNALPTLKEKVDYVSSFNHGDGVIELIEKILEDDLKSFESKLRKKNVVIGLDKESKKIHLKEFDTNVLLLGNPGAGKSTFASSFIERLIEEQYQFCIIDPEGDYSDYSNILIQGSNKQSPDIDEVINLLEDPKKNCIVNLLNVTLEDRPEFFQELILKLFGLRAKTGRPHWIIVDEAHHLLPSAILKINSGIKEFKRMMFITVHPDQLQKNILKSIDNVIFIGNKPDEQINYFCEIKGIAKPKIPPKDKDLDVLFWQQKNGIAPFYIKSIPPEMERRRHIRKYAEGEISPESWFFFRGPENKLNLKVQNLMLFIQIAEGVDDDTWAYHLKRGDYSKWFGEVLKDKELGKLVSKIEEDDNLSPKQSRDEVKKEILKLYTASA